MSRIVYSILLFLLMGSSAVAQELSDAYEDYLQAIEYSLNGEKCRAFSYYNNALKKGLGDEDCRQIAQTYITSYHVRCNSDSYDVYLEKSFKPTGEVVVYNPPDTEHLCTLAVKSKIEKDDSRACRIFKTIKEYGYPNKNCERQSEMFLRSHGDVCSDSSEQWQEMNTAASMPKEYQNAFVSEDLDELCAEAVRAKIKKDTCRSVEIYSRLSTLGYPNAVCQKRGEMMLSDHADECRMKGLNNASSFRGSQTDAESPKALCKEAARARIKKDYCKAVEIYLQAKKLGYADGPCQRFGDRTIELYVDECNDRIIHENTKASAELCSRMNSANMKKERCEAFRLAQKLKKIGYSSTECRKKGDFLIKQNAASCKVAEPEKNSKSKR